MGRSSRAPFVSDWREGPYHFSLPRALAPRVRDLGLMAGRDWEFEDGSQAPPVFRRRDWAQGLRDIQRDAVEALVGIPSGIPGVLASQGIARLPTGSGKTMAALATIARLGTRGLIIVPTARLLHQWVDAVAAYFEVPRHEVGVIGDAIDRPSPGLGVTVALKHSLASQDLARTWREIRRGIGVVLLDEAQYGASGTFYRVVDAIPARYRFAISEDERRADAAEALTHWLFGSVVYEVTRAEVEARGYVVPVTVRVAPYTGLGPVALPRRWKDYLDELVVLGPRNDFIEELVRELLARDEHPVVIFSARREHVADLAARLGGGRLLGGGEDQAEYDRTLAGMRDGSVRVAAATYQAFGVGINVPELRALVCASPLGKDAAKFFSQVRGRAVRPDQGKAGARLYYVLDVPALGRAAGRLLEWSEGRLEQRVGGTWVPVHRTAELELDDRRSAWPRSRNPVSTSRI